jgi:hypothetical protein
MSLSLHQVKSQASQIICDVAGIPTGSGLGLSMTARLEKGKTVRYLGVKGRHKGVSGRPLGLLNFVGGLFGRLETILYLVGLLYMLSVCTPNSGLQPLKHQ